MKPEEVQQGTVLYRVSLYPSSHSSSEFFRLVLSTYEVLKTTRQGMWIRPVNPYATILDKAARIAAESENPLVALTDYTEALEQLSARRPGDKWVSYRTKFVSLTAADAVERFWHRKISHVGHAKRAYERAKAELRQAGALRQALEEHTPVRWHANYLRTR